MAKHLESGRFGENLALNYLRNNGYEILKVNWRYKYWEVDIIAKEGIYLVLVEIKSRKSNLFGEPANFVDDKKQKNLIQAGEAYLEVNNYEGEIRFDIVSVYLDSDKIELIKDAFWSN
ncbi:YraN family protein [Sphingobacterium sp. SGL-16]|uniref:YraN family protein n=1 Tax=Sphingobacterium sp. SGL-16 TaxID=2710883 RepID=UPI0013EB55B4|nr:YraN family protein [Sphingobacterium sp. SGL-16]NGM74772.1 YraN family protein [Sphingobacterium sp. SGL-16]